jgi:ABC-type antimicrobial peptide transport system permease subunit
MLAVMIGSAATAGAQFAPLDYPQWRGRNRVGAASAFAERTSWPETRTRRWKIDVGEGYATPLVIVDVVYAFTGLFAVVTALASYVPARRAATVDPVDAIRCE